MSSYAVLADLVMGIAISIFRRFLCRLSFLNRRISEIQQDSDSKNVDAPRCCNDLTCTSAAKTAKELLTKMEQIQTQLHNEVILWKLRLIRGICTEESRNHFYKLLQQFKSFNGMLDTVIECETKYLDAMQPKHSENEESSKVDAKVQEPRVTASEEKALKRRRTFFAKVHERNVRLLLVVLSEVDECRSMVETNSNGHELSENFTMALEGTSIKSLGVLDESKEEQQPETRRMQETVVFLQA